MNWRARVSGALMLAVVACVPTTAAYLSVPIVSDGGASRRGVELRVPLAELRQRMRGFDRERVAFYVGGREPVPHRFADDDGDGQVDVAVVVCDVAGDGTTHLIAVCPGPAAVGPATAGTAVTEVRLDFDRARG